jgi:hypothetical protein
MATPKALQYSSALKPVSIPVAQQTRKFLPITTGPYNTSNKIIRIPINSNSFLDLKNMVLKFTLKNDSVSNMYLDGNACSIIRTLETISPDGLAFETIDNYSRLYNALVDVERSIDNREGYGNLLEGASNDDILFTIRAGSANNVLEFFSNSKLLGSITTGVVGSIRVGDFLFRTTATADQLLITGSRASVNVGSASATVNPAGDTATLIIGATAGSVYVNDVEFSVGVNNQLIVDNNILTLTAVSGKQNNRAIIQYKPRVHNALLQSELFTNGESKTYAIPLLSCITKMDVLYPAFLVGGGGIILQITVPSSNEEVFFSSVAGQAPSFSVSGVELIVPVLQYPDNVIQTMKQMVQQVGTISMSSYTFKNYTYPYPDGTMNLSIPIAVRVRSLKALYFFFQSNQSSSDYSIPRISARENINLKTYQLRIGSMYYPASKVAMDAENPSEVIVELLKSVSKLNDMRLGTYLNKKNFYLSQSQGGLQVFGIDLEGLQNEYMESGLNTSENALQTFLEIELSKNTSFSGNCQIFAFYDNSVSILSNGQVVATQ